MYTRYAIYFMPAGKWGDLGASWLGWDARSGTTTETYRSEYRDWIKRPQKYGFHATIKAPFRLAQDQSEADLKTALTRLCSTLAPLPLPSLQLSQIGRFFAFTAPTEQGQLVPLASRAVAELDAYRAPLTPADLERRRKARLTPAQDALLEAWGYPYVMEEFRFHLTLTGQIRGDDDPRPALEEHFDPALKQGLTIDALSLMGERADGYFQQVTRVPLGQAPSL